MAFESKSNCVSWQSRPGCACHACQTGIVSGVGAQHRFWRERKLRRHLPQAPSNFQRKVHCSCITCQATEQAEIAQRPPFKRF